MAFWVVMGSIVGALVGVMTGGAFAAILLALVGAGIGSMIGRSDRRSMSAEPAPPASSNQPWPPGRAAEPVMRTAARAPADAMSLVLDRLASIDARLAQIEARIGVGAPATSPLPAPATRPTPAPAPAALDIARSAQSPSFHEPAQQATPSMARAADGRLQLPPAAQEPDVVEPVEAAAPVSTNEPPPRPAYRIDASVQSVEPPRQPQGEPAQARSDMSSAVSRWITGGNALTRVGIVILFFGVAFLLRYFAEIVTVPIGLKLAAAGAGGVALAAIGFVLARARPAYGLSLQGAGMGIVYLTVFAAFRLYEVLSPLPAIALLVAVAATTVWLALRHDSQPLAALALAGGFLAPVLIRTDATNPALLFGYFALLNGVVFALAWKRAWRPLNVLGFVFTFVLGLAWGHRFYAPSHYAIVQPYLILFFAFYVGIAILYARRGPLDARAPVDGVLVFGVPIVGFALQMAIVRGHRYGVAWSAAVLAGTYGALWFLLRARPNEGHALLARAFAALAVIFGTLAIPFAVDPRATSAWWALEAAAVYWLGVVQRQPLARGFALFLQAAAAFVFIAELGPVGGRTMLNAGFLGMALIGAAALASVWAADRNPDRIGGQERALLPWLFAWGVAWWIASGVREMLAIEHPARINGALFWIVASSAMALLDQRVLRWPRIAWMAATLLPAMAIAGAHCLRLDRTTLVHAGWIVWPLAWIVQWAALYAAERLRVATASSQQARDDMLRIAHAVSAIALVAWASWELSEWAGRLAGVQTVWLACGAAVPAIVFLLATVHLRTASRWPFVPHGNAYGATAGTTIAALLFVWLVIVNLTSPGDPAPLPYVPLLNPLDLTLVGALAALALWDRDWGRHPERVRFAWLGAAAFVALNGAVVRTAHHWGDVAWRFEALMAYKPAQAALTLTWTVTALALMLWSTRRGVRTLWTVGAALLAIVVVKLFALDLAALSGLTRVVAFMGVGLLLLVIGYVAPLPPAATPSVADAKP